MINRIVVIGNAGGGKTRISQRLGESYHLPVTHVDAIQFEENLKIRKNSDSIAALSLIENQSKWVIDGFGPLEMIENRFRMADKIVLIDLPLWRHYFWVFKRQLSFFWSRRPEMPKSCNENSWSHFMKVLDSMEKMNRLMRPELLRILQRPEFKGKLLVIRNLKEWNLLFKNGELY